MGVLERYNERKKKKGEAAVELSPDTAPAPDTNADRKSESKTSSSVLERYYAKKQSLTLPIAPFLGPTGERRFAEMQQRQKDKADQISGILAMDSASLGEKASADPQGVAYEYNGQKVTWNQLYKGKKASEEHERWYVSSKASTDWNEKSGLISSAEDAKADHDTLFFLIRTVMPYEWEHAKKDGKTREEWETVTAQREAINRKYGVDLQELSASGDDVALEYILEFAAGMNDEERQILSYLFNTEGFDGAKKFVQTLKDEQDYKAAQEMAAKVKGQTIAPLAYSAASGVEQFFSGIDSLLGAEVDFPSRKLEYASAKMGEDFAEKGAVAKFAYDAVGAVGNLLPSTLVSSAVGLINPVAGAATGAVLMGESATGNAYSQMLDLGYSKEQARNYGVLVGSSEALLQYALGGIGKLGGVVTKGALSKAVSGIDNALAKFAIKWGGSIASEALEEGAQSVLEPVFKALATGEKVEAVNWEQVAYDALLGGALGGAFEFSGTVSEVRADAAAGKAVFGNNQSELVTEGLSHEDGSLANKLAGKYEGKINAGKDLTGTELYTLANANAEASINESAAKIEKELTELGVKGNVKKISTALAKDAAGIELSAGERRLLSPKKYVQELSEKDIERYYKTGKTGHVRNKKTRIREAGGSAVLFSENDIYDFVRNSVESSTAEIKGYAIVPQALSDKIFDETNGHTDVGNWFLELSSDDLFHAFREHQKAKEEGDLDMSIEEFEKLPMQIDGDAEILGIERYKDMTKIKLGVKGANGGNFIVVEMVSSSSQALRMKNAWKVSGKKYEKLQNEKVSTEHKWTSETPAPFNGKDLSNRILSQKNSDVNSKNSLSPEGISIAPPIDGYNVRGEDVVLAPKVEEDTKIDIAPPIEAEPEISIAPKVESESEGDVWKEISDSIRADTLKADSAETVETVETVEEAKAEPDTKKAEEAPRITVKEKLESKLQNSKNELERVTRLRESTRASYDEKIAAAQSEYASIKNKDSKAANTLAKRIERLQRLRDDIDTDYSKRISDIEKRIGNLGRELKKDLNRADRLERRYESIDKRLQAEKAELSAEFEKKRAEAAEAEADKDAFVSKKAKALYDELSELKKGVRASRELGFLLDHGYAWSELKSALINVKESPGKTVNADSVVESVVRESINESYEELLYESEGLDSEYEARVKELDERAKKDRQAAREEEGRETRTALHARLVEGIKDKFRAAGLDLDEVLRKAKDLSTWSTVDNIPQRVMEKALGYKAGGILADETVNKVAQNETEGIKWLNSITDRKSGLLSELSKKYGIKPGSKESAAAQMYAEGFFVDENGDSIEYGDAELAKDFPSEDVQKRIKGLATDPRIREFYDETLDAINESRVRNGYPEIPKLENYFLHFRAMEDTFSRLGLPFNPNDIRAKDLPTDLNGMTADLKPGQPYFASSMHREGKRTSHDLLGGMERYANAAKNQIYHIDDIQTLRALRNYIADMYGQANGLEGLDALSEEDAQEKIKQVYDAHLSTFAKFLNEEANILAGKTSMIDRGLEGVLGRRGISFISTVNGQVGSNMVGFNISSSLTNFLPVVQTFAKTGKYDFLKGFTQTVGHKLGINKDGFTETSPVVIRRRGSDRFYRTPYQKIGDVGYVFMSAVDDISTEIIARAKYNELTRKGMDSQKAHFETDKWVSRLMGDRSLGQMPQLYNSKMLGLITKFQLEVRNQLDSQFYDTIQEAKVSNEHIKNGLARNAKTAAKVTSTFLQLAIAQHLFGAAFEAIAGYNPAFDIISVMSTAFGWGDEEDDEDTVSDNLTEAVLELLDDLPYTSTFTGGRIPISSALPIEELIKGVDEYGNEKPRLETLGESLPYYLLPGGFGQIKKTAKGLSMFDDDLPISGSYTDSGGLRFPVEETPLNVAQAAIFGQWASENASKYFDGGHAPLKEKQIEEFVALDIPIEDYWEIREGLAAQETTEDKFNYIAGLDLPTKKKNILINNAISRKNEVDIEDYEDYSGLEEFDFANNYPEKYEFLKKIGVSYDVYDASEESRAAYNWAYSYPEKYEVSKAVTDDIVTYRTYTSAINKIEADKDANGKTISGSRKAKVVSYINDLDLDYGARIILYKSVYESDDTYNRDIVEYLIEREDVSSAQMRAILTELGFTISSDGSISW